ncbi:sugar-binding transcriptional regulator [Devosia sp. A449]
MSETILSTSVARRFYLDGLSKSEIANELGISRFRVARLIERAVRDGIVRIEFTYPVDEIDYELSAALQARTGLRGAVIVKDTGDDLELMLDSIGKVAASTIRDLASTSQILGIASTRVAEAMTRNLQPFANGAVVQLAGAWPGAVSGQTSVEMVHSIARISNSPSHSFYAPLIASDAEAAQAMRRQADVEKAAALFEQVTTAVIGLGALRDGQTSLWHSLTEQEIAEIRAGEAIGEICGMTYAADGRAVETSLSRRAIGVNLEQLRSCNEVICLAFGAEKADAILGAIRGGIVKTLITHERCARAILQLVDAA